MKGLLWVNNYYPQDWFSKEEIDDDEKYFEVTSMTGERKERIIWLGRRIACHQKWLTYDEDLHQFDVLSQFETTLNAKVPNSGDIWKVNAPQF